MAKQATRKARGNGSSRTAAKVQGPALKAIQKKQTKLQIIRTIAEDTALTQGQVDAVLTSLSTLARRHVMKRGSGEFAIPEMGLKVRRVARKARTARNPMTGEAVRVPAKTVVKATVLKALKEVAA